MPAPTSLLLVDDHPILLESLKRSLAKHPSVEVIGTAANGKEAVAFVKKHHPQLVLMDISMPELDGIKATRQLRKLFPETKTIAFSMHEERHIIYRMFHAGAWGYLLKTSSIADLLAAIRSVMQGKYYLAPQVTEVVLADCIALQTEDLPPLERILTQREQEVLKLITEGASTSEAAQTLQITARTLERHRLNLMNKLGIHNLADLTRYALREGLTDLSLP